jgi:MYXO-CTERM domain-containing protein
MDCRFLVAFVAVFLLADIRHLHKAMTFLFIRPKGKARPNRIGIGMSVIRAVPRNASSSTNHSVSTVSAPRRKRRRRRGCTRSKGGAIAGDAGKGGAAVGAAMGAMIAGVRRRRERIQQYDHHIQTVFENGFRPLENPV